MKQWNLVCWIICLVLLAPGPSSAMDTVKGKTVFADLVAEAFEHNNEIKAMEESIRALTAKAVYDGSLADPQLGFSLSNVPVDSFDLGQEAMTQKQVFLSQTFPWPGKRGLKSRTTEMEALKLAQALKARKLAIAKNLATFYYDLGWINRSLDVNRTTARLIDKMLQVAETRYSSGRGNRQDILMARMERDKRTSERLELESRYRQTESRINALLNRETQVTLVPPSLPDYTNHLPPTSQLVEQALAGNPALSVLRLEEGRIETQKDLTEKSYYPDVNVKLTYGQRDADPMGKSRSDFVSLGASFPIPLWKHQRQDKDLSFREASLHSAALRLKDLEARIPHDIDRLTDDIQDTYRRYLIYTGKLIPSARDLARSAQSDYEVGQAEFGPMITAQINALSMELAADNLLFNLAKRRAELDELLGNPIDLIQGHDHEPDQSR